ncbi:MAG: hypothetical protein ACTHU0_20010, partial [Kofleriaceae bacterium]
MEMHARHGTRYELSDGRLMRIVDRTGQPWAELAWTGDALARLVVPGATLHGATHDDPLVGRAHAIESPTGALATAASALDWAHPTEIPTVAAPGRLAPGAGGAILNAIAVLAARAGVTALHYAGPYPTPALWRTLARSFATAATEEAFTTELVGRAARLARDPIAIAFAPAPHERIAIPGGFVELRERLERVVLEGVTYEPEGSPARLVELDAGFAAELWFGDAPWARVARLDATGALVDGPHPLPACTSEVVGKPFPPALVGALAELVADAVPPPLAGAAR